MKIIDINKHYGKLKMKCFEMPNASYTNRCKQAENENYDTFNLVYNKRNDCSLLSISDCWIYR